jgi:hypothetical protein
VLGDIALLKGAEGELRRRVGAWRIIFEVDAERPIMITYWAPESRHLSWLEGLSQYQRPRPYHPNPPHKKMTTTMIKSVFVSIAVLSLVLVASRWIFLRPRVQET